MWMQAYILCRTQSLSVRHNQLVASLQASFGLYLLYPLDFFGSLLQVRPPHFSVLVFNLHDSVSFSFFLVSNLKYVGGKTQPLSSGSSGTASTWSPRVSKYESAVIYILAQT